MFLSMLFTYLLGPLGSHADFTYLTYLFLTYLTGAWSASEKIENSKNASHVFRPPYAGYYYQSFWICV